MPVALRLPVPASDWSGLILVDFLISFNLWFSWFFDSCFFFFFFFEILGSTQILGFMRQPPCLGLLRGSCPTLVGCGSSGSSAFPAPVMLLDVFGLSHEIRTPAGLWWGCLKRISPRQLGISPQERGTRASLEVPPGYSEEESLSPQDKKASCTRPPALAGSFLPSLPTPLSVVSGKKEP